MSSFPFQSIAPRAVGGEEARLLGSARGLPEEQAGDAWLEGALTALPQLLLPLLPSLPTLDLN